MPYIHTFGTLSWIGACFRHTHNCRVPLVFLQDSARDLPQWTFPKSFTGFWCARPVAQPKNIPCPLVQRFRFLLVCVCVDSSQVATFRSCADSRSSHGRYYFAMTSNLVLRLVWTVTIMPFADNPFFSSGDLYNLYNLPLPTSQMNRYGWGGVELREKVVWIRGNLHVPFSGTCFRSLWPWKFFAAINGVNTLSFVRVAN